MVNKQSQQRDWRVRGEEEYKA